MILPPEDIDFEPWIICTPPNGDAAISDQAPQDIKDAWNAWINSVNKLTT